jgi:hypothetical protein
MNWKLIFRLSLFGLVMAIATVYWIPQNIEPFFWLVIFVICAYLIAKRCNEKYFLHGFMVSIFNCVWIIAVHLILYDTYMAHHADMAAQMNAKMPGQNPRVMQLVIGPVIGVVSGLILGLFSLIASRMIKTVVA